ncbi:hypothetical protein [Inquilinus limosus]|uniref:hypothetical protein n=1 Tax=Inquilinus limosus TaxID=171674 RepID=UPI003F5CE0D0
MRSRVAVDVHLQPDHALQAGRHLFGPALHRVGEGRPFGAGHRDPPAAIDLPDGPDRGHRQVERFNQRQHRRLAERRPLRRGRRRPVQLDGKGAGVEDLGLLARSEQASDRRQIHGYIRRRATASTE